MSDDGWEARMAARAHARAAAAMRLPDGRPYEQCMTGDGNLCVPPAGLCQVCLDRPYGTPGDLHGVDVCGRCWIDRYVWVGNSWGIVHVGGSFSVGGCVCDCHRDEVWLASAAGSTAGTTR